MAYPLAPRDAGGDAPGLIRQALRQVSAVVNRSLSGKLNCTGDVTLTANATTTTVTDARATFESAIHLCPTTLNAAGSLGTTYVSTRNNGSFTLTHANNVQTDRTFRYTVIG